MQRFLVARTSAIAGLIVAAVVLGACGGASSRNIPATQTRVTAQPSPRSSATPSALTPSRQYKVLVGAGSIQPARLTLPVNVAVRIEITNTGPACEFFVGDYLRGLVIAQGEVDESAFVVSNVPAGAPASTSVSTMGCIGDNRRQAQFATSANPPSQNGVETRAAIATPMAGLREIGFELQADIMRPHEVDLPYNARVHLTVVNQGAACLFTFGEYLRGLAIPAGGNADVTLTVANRLAGTSTPSPRPSIGCMNDSQRQGQLVLSGPPSATPTTTRALASSTPTATAPR
jgi:hypothetical protein